MRHRRLLIGVTAAFLLVGLVPAGADEEPVRGETTVVGEDAAGDAEVAGIGADLTAATITPVGDDALAFGLTVADMPATLNGTPEVIHYNWEFTVEVDGESPTTYSLQAIRTAQGETIGSQEPVFRLATCAPSETGGSTCTTSFNPAGTFAAEGLEMVVPFAEVGAEPCAEITPGADINASAGVSGLIWYTNGVGGDIMFADDYELDPAADATVDCDGNTIVP